MFKLRREVYLDNNATTKISREVNQKVSHILKTCYGNPSSVYRIARNSAEQLDESRRIVSETINAQVDEIYFTGSASEANNMVLKSLFMHFYPKKHKIISSPIEHASVMSTLQFLQTQGVQVEYCPVDREGRISIEKLALMLDEDTFLVCIMLANNETGTIQDVKAISQLVKNKNILLMSDCVQSLGKINVDVQDLGVDYATFSAHKIHGPKGVGALFAREGAPLFPLIHGGHQEFGLRAGTESLHNIAGFATACEGVEEMLHKSDHTRHLTKNLRENIKKIYPGCVINSPKKNCLPNTVSVTFPGINNAILMAVLDFHGIYVSAGSACNTQADEPSHVLKAIGLSDEEARSTIRFSLSTSTSQDDISYVLKVLEEYSSGEIPTIQVVLPSQLNENLIFNKDTYILDVRFWHDRKMLKGLPNSHEASFLGFKDNLHQVPRNKNIIVVCQAGYNAPIIAYYLKSKNYKHVSFLLSGLVGWRITHKATYKKYAGQNISILKTDRRFLRNTKK